MGLQVCANNLLDAAYMTAYDRPGVPLSVGVGVRVGR